MKDLFAGLGEESVGEKLDALIAAVRRLEQKIALQGEELAAARRDMSALAKPIREGKRRARQEHMLARKTWEPRHPYLEEWNEVAERRGFPTVMRYTTELREALTAREREPLWGWPSILREADRFDPAILKGSDVPWFDLRWIARSEDNYVKLLEGKYRSRGGSDDDLTEAILARGNG